MIKCKNCKWWDKDLSFCDFLEALNDDEIIVDEAFEDDCYILIKTGANFGCVHGELKEVKNNG